MKKNEDLHQNVKKEFMKNEKKYQNIFENLMDVYFKTSFEGTIFELSPSVESLFKGLPKRDNLIGQSVLDIYSEPKQRTAFINLLQQKEAVSDYEIMLKNGDGSVIPCSVSAKLSFNSQGIPQKIIGNIHNISYWKHFEKKLLGKNYKLRLMLDNSADAILLTNKQGKCIYTNHATKKLFGFISKETESELIKNIIPEHRKNEWSRSYSIILTKGKIFTEFEFQKKDGTLFPVELRSFLIKNDNEEEEYIWSSIRNITKHKKAEAELIKKEKFLSSIIENIPDMVFIKDAKDLKYVHFNKAGENLLGYCKEKIIGKNDYDFFTKEMADFFTKKDKEVIKLNKQLHIPEEIIDTKHGRRILSTKKLTIPDKNGKPAYLLGISRDITERKEAEAKAKESDAYYRTLINISPDGIMVTNLKGIISFASEKLSQIYEAPNKESLIGESAYNWIAPESFEEAKKDYRNLINGKKLSQPRIYKSLKFDHTVFWVELSFSLLRGSSGNPTGLMITCRDISKRKRIEEELNLALHKAEESNRLKSAFLTNMSHEIRTPMNGIMGFTDLLKEPGLSGEKQQEFIKIIEQSGKRMLNLINNIISISKIESGVKDIHPSKTNINEQLNSIYMLLKPEAKLKGLNFSLFNNPPDKEVIIKTDSNKFYTILSNLVKNAIKFTDKGKIEFGYIKIEQSLIFYVTDTGIGIAKEKQKAIFERFIQADITDKMARQGAGLGLAISKAYVEMLGGKIWLESEKGKGSSFYFNLPYHTKSEEKNTTKGISMDSGSKNQINPEVPGLKILIVDDDKTTEMLISIQLKEISKEILIVSTGIQAIETCRKHPDVDLVLMDIQMPEMNGYEATRQIRQFNKDVIIIAQTAFALSHDRQKAIEAGCTDYISKPFKKAELLALLKKYFKD